MSWLRAPVSLVMFRPSVPLPEPVETEIFHVVSGSLAWMAVPRLVMEGAVSPAFTKAKWETFRPLTGWEKTTCQPTSEVLFGLLSVRTSETTVASGRSTGVVVGSVAPAKAGSSVRTLVMFPPLTVPWLLMSWVPGGLFTRTVPTMVTLLPAGRVPMSMVAPR